MERATIVTLGNAVPMTATSFEEAFGEFSEARGRGRARRQKRKMERITNRKTRRTARQQGRLEKKKSRVEARTQRRTMRADNREQRRAQKSEGKRMRERADLEQEREFAPAEEPQEAPQEESGYAPQGGGGGGYAPQGGGGGGYAEEQGGYAEEQGGYAPQGGGYAEDEGGYAEEQGGYEEQGGGYDEGYGDDGGYAEEGGYEESDGFDGVIGTDNEMIDVPYSAEVSQNVADAAKKIEWNLELASRLKDKAKTNPSQKINDAINNCQNRVAQLESSMDGYCNFEGDFTSDAEGKMAYRRYKGGKGLSKQERRARRQEMMLAKKAARRERNAVRKRSGLTPVQGDINPRIGMNSIVLPAKEVGSSATGIIGLDDAMDYDASAYEIKLGADGATTSKIPFKTIAIGLAVGALGVFLLRKYKVI
jgi:hypothetical protein